MSFDEFPLEHEESAGTPTIDAKRLLRALRKYKWIIVACAVVGLGGAVAYTNRLPKRYTAVASAVIDPNPPIVMGGEVAEVAQIMAGGWYGNQEYFNTQVAILRSREFAKIVATRHELHKNPAFLSEAAAKGKSEDEQIAAAAGALLSMITVKPPNADRIVKIVTNAGDPEVAALAANAHVETYIEHSKQRLTTNTTEVIGKLQTELSTAEQQLRESETALSEFLENNNVLSFSAEDKQNQVASELSAFSSQLTSVRAERITLEALRKRVHEARKMDLFESPLFALTDGSIGTSLKSQYFAEKQKLLDLEKSFGPKHQDVVTQNKKLAEIRTALENEADLAVAALDEKYAALVSTENGLAAALEQHKQEAFKLAPKEATYNRLARAAQHNEKKYNMVLERLGASDIASRVNEAERSHLLDKAQVPGGPSYPNMQQNAVAGLMFGLFLGLGIALLLEILDRTIKSPEDVEQATGAPLLGVIPATPRLASGPERDLLVARDPKSQVAECCRSIRTNLLFMSADHEFKTLTVTSPNPKEGKTTSVLYLGTTMAQAGQKVLIIDTDMRRPRLHSSLETGRAKGLSSVILGEDELDDAIRSTEVPGLSILPCGPTPPNPAELLMTERFRHILEELEGKYDRILLDSPPILAVTDAVVLSQRSDGVLLVMKADGTLRVQAQRCAKALRDVNARVAGVVLNQLDLNNKLYGYYHHYYGYTAHEEAAAETA